MTRARLMEWTTTVDIDGEEREVTVAATVIGHSRPAKLYGDDAHPAEPAEVEIDCVKDAEGVDVLDMLSLADLQAIEEEADARAAEEEAEAAADAAERRAEEARDEMGMRS